MAASEDTGNSSARIQIIVALIGLLGVVGTALIANWNNIFPKPTPASTSSSTSTPTPTSSTSAAKPITSISTPPDSHSRSPKEPMIYSSGQAVVRGTWSWDLDLGSQNTAGGDFWWDQQTATTRYLTPKNGAVFFVVGMRDFNSLSYSDLERFPFSGQKIDASNAVNNSIPTNTVVAYRTNEGRLGKFLVVDYGYNLTIRWVTYQK